THIRRTVREDDALRQMLDRIDRLSVPADEQPHVLTAQATADHPGRLLDLDLHIETEAVRDLLEQLLERLGGLELLADRIFCAIAVAHRRRPERFFFLRGARGGGGPVAGRPLTPARAGSPLG